MSIDCPGHSGPSDEEGVIVDEVIIGTEENMFLALENEDFESLAAMMRAEPEAALELYESLKSSRDDLAKDLTPYFTRTAYYTMDDQDIKTRLELLAVLPRTMAGVEKAIERTLGKLDSQDTEPSKPFKSPQP